MKIAIIDISSGGVSFAVFNSDGENYETVTKERNNIALMSYVNKGALNERGADKIIQALTECKNKCIKLGADKCYVISTALMRSIGNGIDLEQRIKRELGIELNYLTGETEARCDYLSNAFYANTLKEGGAFLVDLGGASIELCSITSAPEYKSLTFGAMTVRDKFVESVQPSEKEAKKIRKYAEKRIEKIKLDSGESTAILVGATAAAVYDIYADKFSVKREADEEKVITYKKLKKLTKHLIKSTDRSMLILKNAPEKIHTVIGACILFTSILKHFDAKEAIVSNFGVKEGFLMLVNKGEFDAKEWNFKEKQTPDSGSNK